MTGATVKTDTGDSFGYRRRRSKTDWAGVGMGDAFKANLDYFARMPAQRLFYDACKRVQLVAAALAGAPSASAFQSKVKPQLSPCYTSYPSTLAAYAAIGLTGFLEFQARASAKTLSTHLAAYLKEPALHDHVAAEPELYKKLAEVVTDSVETRLLLEEFARLPAMSLVEIYRLFSAAQQQLRFESVPEIVNAVILYGDILPDWQAQPLHSLTRLMLADLDHACRPYFDQLANVKPQELVTVGMAWVRAICICLSKYLPRPKGEAESQDAVRAPPADSDDASESGSNSPPRYSSDPTATPPTDKIAPLNGPNPPALFAPPSAAERAASALLSDKAGQSEGATAEPSAAAKAVVKALEEFASAVNQAGGQDAKWEDLRSDLLEHTLRAGGFSESPIEGNPTEGHEITLRLGKDNFVGGEIHDRPVELSDDILAYDKLLEQSRPVTDALRRTLYPSLEELTELERLRTNGALDSARLCLAEFSQVVFQRHRVHQIADRRGQPVLLIACDGSGSLNPRQMQMLKVLTAAWLNSTARSRIQVLAGLYHSGAIREGVSGPLIQWMYHPHKTPSTSRKDAARALVSLPNDGTGAQSDALSLAFMLAEARRLAQGRMIYLILISDCEWNRSFGGPKTGKEEVQSLFETVYAELRDKLHTTLVALGVKDETGFEQLLDKVITVPQDKLDDCAAIAEQIGVYVASCMKERRKSPSPS